MSEVHCTKPGGNGVVSDIVSFGGFTVSIYLLAQMGQRFTVHYDGRHRGMTSRYDDPFIALVEYFRPEEKTGDPLADDVSSVLESLAGLANDTREFTRQIESELSPEDAIALRYALPELTDGQAHMLEQMYRNETSFSTNHINDPPH
ncbi:hypothetical protein HYU10_02365 [Candidatus Woesearchaeota archaeon]|nr:hypothetical protein [Candidatus Woesearchaeota archaeon]MBI2130591.1 hypothetical protein [Candidatus Woesearchaeota archaeon]MBI2660688.1 hypothetical protein [Candidatus Woesearchaeota archaeon]